jgi:signal transduction histidine kinase
MLNDRRRVLLLVLILTAIASVLGSVAILILYETAFDQERQRLADLARTQADVVEALYIRLQKSGMAPEMASEVAIQLIREARSRAPGFRASGEFTLARRQGDSFVYRIRDRATPLDEPLTLSLEAEPGARGEPMRLALAGDRGTVVGLDYRGVKVLAAYQPLPLLTGGIVAKIDLAEIRAPFLRAGLAVASLGLILVILGTTLFFRVSEPMLRKLRSDERRYRELIDHLGCGVAVLRATDGGRDFLLADLNQAGEAIDEVRRADIVGRRLKEVLPDWQTSGVTDLCRMAWRTGAAGGAREIAWSGDRRPPRWREYRLYRLPDGDIVCLYDDISGRRATEARLQQTQKLEVLGQLTGGIAHDFNNVLAIVLGNLQLLEEKLTDPDDRALLGDALWGAERGAELTHQLLAYARQQPLDPRLTDINQLIRGMTDLLRRTLHAAITIRERLAPDLWPALIDGVQLQSAIVNLIVNARDAMPAGGELTIETRNTTLDETARVVGPEAVVPGEYVLVAVRDTGIGMAADVVERAFEPFFTTKGPAKGSGLGLSMVYGFVKQSGGHVRIASQPMAGTSVELCLPRAHPPVAIAAAGGDGAAALPPPTAPATGLTAARPE